MRKLTRHREFSTLGFLLIFPKFWKRSPHTKNKEKGQLSIAAQLRTSCHVVVGLPYKESAGPKATVNEPWISAKDSHGLCISSLGTKHAQASLSNPKGCPHCSKFSLKTREQRLRVAVIRTHASLLNPKRNRWIVRRPAAREER